ncbi:UNVERIFIED_CONTAM: hypothetical protein ABIC26_002653 [Paenibacillus sp. PvR008]
MTQEEFDKQYNDPVNLVEAQSALSRLINRSSALKIPATPEDDDMLISRALNELKNMRARCALQEYFLGGISSNLGNLEGGLPCIENIIQEYFEYLRGER